MFSAGDDPGPDFASLIRRVNLFRRHAGHAGLAMLTITHGTTVVAVRYVDGVVMAGDRRATSGNFISHRSIEKVFPADRYSGVAIAGAAGPAMDMVKLFQLQLEHYEKVEGAHLSLEGKANQLSSMVRTNLPAAMQGLAVVPLFAGYDLRRGTGRLFQYDITGGRYEEFNHAATGSGSLHAGAVVKMGYRPNLDRGEVMDLALSALFQAADEDSATGGPDLIRGIFPVMATITADGFERADDTEIAERFDPPDRAAAIRRHRAPMVATMSMPFYVAPEQVMKDRADYARKGIARGRSLVGLICTAGILVVAENPSDTLRKVSEIYDRIAFAGVGRYNEFDQLRVAGVRAADLKGFQYSREDVDARSLANQYAQILGQIFTHEMKPMEVEILVAEVADGEGTDQLFHILYDGTVLDETSFSVLGGEADAITERMKATWTSEPDLAAAVTVAVGRAGWPQSPPERGRSRSGHPRPRQRPAHLPPPRRRRRVAATCRCPSRPRSRRRALNRANPLQP